MPHAAQQSSDTLFRAANVELTATADQPPAQVELIPAGPAVVGRDGRAWQFSAADAHALVAAFNARGAALPIDWEHASQYRAPQGKPAPAAGWIESLNVREDGALIGNVSWTDRGAADVTGRAYRYLSPTFDFEKDSRRIVRLVSAGLTNLANLRLAALNHETNPEDSEMNKITVAIATALALGADATEEQALNAIGQLQQRAGQASNLDQFVPRADYDAAVERANNAEQALSERDQATHTAAVDAAIDGALKAGKITPATADYHRASCSDEAGLKRFKDFVAAAPTVGDDTNLGERKPANKDTALNAEEQAICQATGVTPEEFIAARAAV